MPRYIFYLIKGGKFVYTWHRLFWIQGNLGQRMKSHGLTFDHMEGYWYSLFHCWLARWCHVPRTLWVLGCSSKVCEANLARNYCCNESWMENFSFGSCTLDKFTSHSAYNAHALPRLLKCTMLNSNLVVSNDNMFHFQESMWPLFVQCKLPLKQRHDVIVFRLYNAFEKILPYVKV